MTTSNNITPDCTGLFELAQERLATLKENQIDKIFLDLYEQLPSKDKARLIDCVVSEVRTKLLQDTLEQAT